MSTDACDNAECAQHLLDALSTRNCTLSLVTMPCNEDTPTVSCLLTESLRSTRDGTGVAKQTRSKNRKIGVTWRSDGLVVNTHSVMRLSAPAPDDSQEQAFTSPRCRSWGATESVSNLCAPPDRQTDTSSTLRRRVVHTRIRCMRSCSMNPAGNTRSPARPDQPHLLFAQQRPRAGA